MNTFNIFAPSPLVTTKGTKWKFTLGNFNPDIFESIQWSYGSCYGNIDNDKDPTRVRKWDIAGKEVTSNSIPFKWANPYYVKVVWKLKPNEDTSNALETEAIEDIEQPEKLPEKGEKKVLVYPGQLKILQTPLFYAQHTEGSLPVMLQINGYGSKVLINDGKKKKSIYCKLDFKAATSAKKSLKSKEYSTVFLANNSNSIDTPARKKNNGLFSRYNYYMSPNLLKNLGENKGPIIQESGVMTTIIRLHARPNISNLEKWELLNSTSILSAYYCDKRIALVHFEIGRKKNETKISLTKSVKKGDSKYIVLDNNGDTQKDLSGWVFLKNQVAAPGVGERLIREDRSKKNHENINLYVKVKDTTALYFYYDYFLRTDVSGATRGSEFFQYYKIKRTNLPDVMNNIPYCLIDDISGNTTLELHTPKAEATLKIKGLLNERPTSYNESGVVASVASTVGALVGAVAAGTVGIPIGLFALAAGISGIAWSVEQGAIPETSVEGRILSVYTMHDQNGTKIDVQSKLSPEKGYKFKNGENQIDANYSRVLPINVGYVVRAVQSFSLLTIQEIEEGYDISGKFKFKSFKDCWKISSR